MDALNNQDAEHQELTVPQPEVIEICFDKCSARDQHNCHHHDTLQTERKIQTNNWDKRVTISLFGISESSRFLQVQQGTSNLNYEYQQHLNIENNHKLIQDI